VNSSHVYFAGKIGLGSLYSHHILSYDMGGGVNTNIGNFYRHISTIIKKAAGIDVQHTIACGSNPTYLLTGYCFYSLTTLKYIISFKNC